MRYNSLYFYNTHGSHIKGEKTVTSQKKKSHYTSRQKPYYIIFFGWKRANKALAQKLNAKDKLDEVYKRKGIGDPSYMEDILYLILRRIHILMKSSIMWLKPKKKKEVNSNW